MFNSFYDLWLAKKLSACSIELDHSGSFVEATFECLELNFTKALRLDSVLDEDASVQVYANFFPLTGHITMIYTVDHPGQVPEVHVFFPSSNDRMAVLLAMEATCAEEHTCSMTDLFAGALQKPQYIASVAFGSTEPSHLEDMFHVLLPIDLERYKDACHAPTEFFMTAKERQEAYERATTAIGPNAISNFVIRTAQVYRASQFLLIEATDNDFWEISFHDDRASAKEAMVNRLSDVTNIPTDQLLARSGDEFDDDTALFESSARTTLFGNSYDWSIFEVPPIPASKVEDKDPRFLLLTLHERDIHTPELCDNAEDAFAVMVSRMADSFGYTVNCILAHANSSSSKQFIVTKTSAKCSDPAKGVWLIESIDDERS